jgi:hypothetical protein
MWDGLKKSNLLMRLFCEKHHSSMESVDVPCVVALLIIVNSGLPIF